jgi:YYY domain-containing protein
MIDFFLWLIVIVILGWLAFPVCFTFFKKAFDRGYGFAKVVGLLLLGYIYWLGNLVGLLSNNRAGAISALLLLGIVSFFFVRKQGWTNILGWIKSNRSLVIAHELVFVCAFLLWAIVRGANPEISGTEKPMELAFINGIFRSPNLPPNDPWLSGYSISYYYFGYLIVAVLMQLTGTISGVAFNLMIALTFGLVAAGSWGILVNLLVKKSLDVQRQLTSRRLRGIMLSALLAPLFILILSNGEGFLEMLYARGLFWNASLTNSTFWKWLDIQDLINPPALPLHWIPSRAGGSWWWRASRVLQDYTIGGQSREIIDEFPFFSYLLADLHPHVLAMPTVLLAIYAGFYVFQHSLNVNGDPRKLLSYFKSADLWLLAFTTGCLIFMNTWDFPIYFGLIALAFIIPVIRKKGWNGERLLEFFAFALPFGIASIVLFLPFLAGLSSQAGGFLPSLVFRTRFVHFLVMFFPLIIPLTVFTFIKAGQRENMPKIVKVFLFSLTATLLLFLLSLAIPAAAEWLPRLMPGLGEVALQSLLGIFGAVSSKELIIAAVQKLVTYPWLLVYLLLLISTLLVSIFKKEQAEAVENEKISGKSKADTYVMLLILLAALLVLVPEFFYLRDQFGWRMNTIFKFYFQVWILFAVAGAYAISSIAFLNNGWRKSISIVLAVLVIGVGMVYPPFAILDKTNSFRNIEWTLDGNRFYEQTNTQDYQAIEYLAALPYGTVAEAIGGSYSSSGRVSKLSGYPTVLGWPGHELQWRGGGTEMGSRESDIKLLYETDDWATAMWVLDQNAIKYVFVGPLERSTYQVREEKFTKNMTVVFQNDGAVIYSYAGIN